jgi:hypothetical protein
MDQGQDAGRHIRRHKIPAPRRNVVRPIPNRDAIPIQVPKRAPSQRAIQGPIHHASPIHRHANRRASHPATRMLASASRWPANLLQR